MCHGSVCIHTVWPSSKLKTESTRKLSNFNFQWTKTLHQNEIHNIVFFLKIFKGYRYIVIRNLEFQVFFEPCDLQFILTFCVQLNLSIALISTAFIKEQRHNRVKVRARKFQLMEKYYSAWKNKVKVKAEEKIEETGKEVNDPCSKLAMSTIYPFFSRSQYVCHPARRFCILWPFFCKGSIAVKLIQLIYLSTYTCCPTHFAWVWERIFNKNIT